jgi:hypothetical protein
MGKRSNSLIASCCSAWRAGALRVQRPVKSLSINRDDPRNTRIYVNTGKCISSRSLLHLALLKSGWVGADVWAWRERRPRLANASGAQPGPSRAWPSAPACGGCGLDKVLTVRPAGRHAVYGRDRAGAAFASTHGPSKSLHVKVLPFVRRAAGVSNPREARGGGTPFVPTTPVEHRAQGESPRRGRSAAEHPA